MKEPDESALATTGDWEAQANTLPRRNDSWDRKRVPVLCRGLEAGEAGIPRPLRARLAAHFGMSETPLPMATRLIIVWSFSLSWTSFGATFACRQIFINES